MRHTVKVLRASERMPLDSPFCNGLGASEPTPILLDRREKRQKTSSDRIETAGAFSSVVKKGCERCGVKINNISIYMYIQRGVLL